MKREQKIWILFSVLAAAIVIGQILFRDGNSTVYIDVITAIITLGTLFLLVIEIGGTKDISEAQIIVQLNGEFINSPKMTNIEHKLEEYYYHYRNGTKKNKLKLNLKLGIKNDDRQDLINYLVHLEEIALLVESGVLHLDVISDLIAYRYFIAVNNPIVQKYELIPYADYYQGCYRIYERWSKYMLDNSSKIPLEEYGLIKLRARKK